MSSLDYPEDFENNNPFAEPVISDQVNGVHSQMENNETQLPEGEPTAPQSGEPSPDPNSESILTEDELRKLIPERFTTKYSLSIQLVEIEKNKPGTNTSKFETIKYLLNFTTSLKVLRTSL